MNPDFQNASELERLVSMLIDDRLSYNDKRRLNELLIEKPDAVREYNELLDNHAALNAVYPGDIYQSSMDDSNIAAPVAPLVRTDLSNWDLFKQWGLPAFLVLAVVTLGWLQIRQQFLMSKPRVASATEDSSDEQTISGHATLRRALDVDWQSDISHRAGDVLPAGEIRFSRGVAEIDFFCGATLIVEGPARLHVESDWEVRVEQGRMRVNVPPAARGFVAKVNGAEVVDLGTEFALDVGPRNVHVEVVDGEVELRGGQFDGDRLVTGESRFLMGDTRSGADLRTRNDVREMHETEQRSHMETWQEFSRQMRTDERLIAYYPIADSVLDRRVPNATSAGSERDGTIVGLVNRAQGRFSLTTRALEFDRPGSRVRVRIDGEYKAFSFACWVKIDSLDHLYNGLFMSDGYEDGEPHWQIREDGRVMFSVMVDDTPGAGLGRAPDARLHHIYFTDPVWDVSMSGEWLHLAAVYDPTKRVVTQFLNGNAISSEKIRDRFYVPTLRIGPAEIGNWGQPFRKTPGFAVRNLNGAIGELAIYHTALTANEVLFLYDNSKPFGY